MSHTQRESYLSHLYVSEQHQAYDIVLDLVNEVEALKKQLAEVTAQNPTPHVVNIADFNLMISNSAQAFVKRAFPVLISNKPVSSGHEPQVFMIEAFIGHLTKHELLRKPVNFDYRK